MLYDINEMLVDLDQDLDRVRLEPAAAIRARGQARARNRRITVTVAVMMIVVGIGLGTSRLLAPSAMSPAGPGPAASSVSGSVAPPDPPRSSAPCGAQQFDFAIPEPNHVTVDVYDRTGHGAGTAAAVVSALQSRDFHAGIAAHPLPSGVGLGDPGPAAGAAVVLRYGPAAVGAAARLRVNFDERVTMLLDVQRTDTQVDVILGDGFTRLQTQTEVNQALVRGVTPIPTAPPPCQPPGASPTG